jgi:hypothetical protein
MTFIFFALVPLFILGVFVLIIVAIVRALTRAGNSSAGSAAPSIDVATQLGGDGFWIVSCPFDPGSILHYRYWSNGLERAGKAPFQPDADGRQFVYTGERPERVLIVQVDEPSDGGILVAPPIILAPTIVDTGGAFWDSSSDSGGGGVSSPASSSFPSAY